MKEMSLHEVSELAGVSIATVSRVINGTAKVRSETKARVEQAIRDTNYQPSFAGRMLRSSTTDTIGVIFPDLDSGFYTEILKSINTRSLHHQYDLVVAFGSDPEAEMSQIRKYVHQKRVDALIVMNLDLPKRFIQTLGNGSVPIVLLDRSESLVGHLSVSIDNTTGTAEAMRHLIEGHRYSRIAVMTGPSANYDSIERLNVCHQVAAELGLPESAIQLLPGDFTEQSGFELAESLIHTGAPLPDALFALNDPMAFGAILAFKQHGLEVPRDIALLGFDDTSMAKHLGLSSVQVPFADLGGTAVDLAVKAIRGGAPGAKTEHRVPTKLIVRHSCGGPTHLQAT